MKGWVLILGASGDIGSAGARVLAASGYSLYLHAHRHSEKAAALRDELTKKYPQQDFLTVFLDCTRPEEVPEFLQQLFQVDGVVFAQGKTYYGLLREMDFREIRELYQIQLETPILLLQKLEEKLSRCKNGRIVWIGSVYGIAGSGMETFYSSLKGAQQAFCKAYSREVATLGITANVIAPGAVDTQMNRSFTPEEVLALKSAIPLQRMASPAEIAYWVGALFAPAARFMTGETLPVTGGWLY